MREFTFDLQRFANPWQITRTGTTYSSLANACNAAQDGDTIILKQSGIYGNGFTISKSVTIDLGGYTYTINDGSTYGDNVAAFGVASGSTVTFKNGTLNKRVTGYNTRSDRTIAVNATGSVVLNDITVGRTVTSSAGTVTVTGSSSVPGGATTYILENGVSFVASASITLTTTADKTASIVASSGRTITATESDSLTVVYKVTASSVTFNYDADGNASVTDLSSGKAFSVQRNNGATVTYTMSAGGLSAASDNITKIWEGSAINSDTSLAIDDLDFDTSTNFTAAILTSSNVLTISNSDALKALNAGETLKVVDDTDYTKSFGYLTKIDDNTYSLTKDSSNNKILSGIVINDDLTVQFDRNFQSVPITVTGSASGTTSLQAASANAFTLSNSNAGVASVEGAVQVSLVGGSLKTANAQTTIRAGSYTANYATTTGDGVNIIATTKATQISGIDSGEAFSVSGSRYYRDDTGLRTGSSGVFTSDIATISNNDNSLSIDLAKLKSSVGSFIQPDNKGVLEFGKTNTGYAVVVNDTSSPTVKYAELLVDSSSTLGNAYTLRPSADSNTDGFLGAVDTVSLTGGRGTTIYKSLVDDKVIAATSGSRPDATFKVSTSNDTFTVTLKTTSAETKISTDATGITLLSGTINAAAGQTITLGEGGRQFYVSSSSNGMNVTFEGSTATITGAKNDTFTIDGTQYSVGNASDGMTFTVTEDNVIITDFSTSDSDAFTYGGRTYSVQGAGFLMTQSGKHSLWSDGNNNHSLTGGTLTIESLFTNDHTWDAVETVDAANAAATLPPSDNDATVTLIGDDFEDTFGVFIKQGTAVTVTTGSADDEKKLSRISVGSAIDEFFFGETLTDISIVSDVATFIVTEDDSDGGYQVSLTSSASDEKLPAMVGGARRASLITGSLQSDSYFTATVLDNRIIAQNDAKVILTATTKDASINGLKDTERFSVEGGGIYTMSKVGLVDDQSRYLLGTREGNPIILSELNGDTPWGGLIDVDDNNEITITSGTGTALVVDIDTTDADKPEPSKLYADFTNINGTQALRVANSADDWGDIVVNVQDTTVNFSSYFSKENIRGVRSGADFIVEDNSAFAVTDTLTGALIGTAKNIRLNSGTVSLTSGQTIHSKAGSITAATGNLTFTVTDDDATIGALDNKDVFSLQSAASTVEYTKNRLGIVTGDNRILTGKAIDASVTVDDLLTGLQPETADGLWTNTVQLTSKNVLNIPQNVTSSSPWVILSSGKDSAFGTMETVEGGYSIHKSDSSNAVASLESDWTSGTFSINSATVTFTKDYSGAYISGYQSKASVNAVNALGDFMFTDGTAGATITGDGATTVNQRAGLVAPQVGQSIVAGTTGLYTISRTSENNDIQVSVSGKAATVTGLSEGDEFTINDHNFVVLGDGVIRRDGSEYLQTGTSETAANLVGSWYGRLKINSEQGQNLTLTSALVGAMSADTCYIVHENNDKNIYGTISRSSVSSGGYAYTLSTTGKNVDTFQSVTIATEVASVTFADSYFVQNSIPITAGDANFKVTSATNNTFAVNYDYTTQHANSTGTAVSLGGGTLDLSATAQTITAGSNTVKVGSNSKVAVTYSDSTLTVSALDAANESVIISGYTYTYGAGNGMTIEVAADGTTTFKGLDDDTFTTASDGTTYTKTSTGFVKKNSDGSTYMWTNTDLDVGGSDGVNIGQLTNAANWTQIKALANGELTIDSTSTDTVVLVGSETDPAATIYGTLTVSGATRTLTPDGGKNAELTKITIDGVAVTIGDDYSTVPIVPQNGATINISTPMTFQPAVGTTFTVNYSGRTYEYNLTQSDSNYVLTLEGMSLTQSDNKYTLPGGSNWRFHEGTVSIEDGVTVTVTDGTKISGEGGYLTATATAGKWTTFGSLTAGDKFTISTTDNSTTYAVLADGKTFGKYSAAGEITQFLSSQISNSTLTYETITDGTYNDVMTITDEGVLDLTSQPTATLSNVPVYSKTNGVFDPTKDIGTVSYSATGGYTLGNSGTAIGDLNSISLGTVKVLTTTIYKPVTTASSGTFTVNNASFEAANSVLTIEPSSSGVALTGGKVNLTAGSTVLTGGGTVTASTDNTTAITVEAGDDITIGGLSSGVKFNVNGTNYTMSLIGLSYMDGSEEKLLDTGSDVTIAELNGQWETILDATGGTLTISPTTTELAAVVDKNSGIRYGTLTKTTSGYTFTQGESTTTSLSTINLNGVTATLPSTTSAAITTGTSSGTATASFTVTASGAFTVDATKSVPEFTNVTAINLSNGTITADTDVRITVSGRTVSAVSDTSDQMTVSYDGTNATVGGLNAGDKFTVGNITYEVTNGNELYDTTNKQIVTTGFNASAKTYTISDDTNPVTLITLNNGVLNLTGTFTDGYSARIVQSLDEPSSKIATLSYSSSGGFTVNDAGTYSDDLKSITLPANNTALTTTVNTTVNTARGSATYTINGKTFTASRSALVIETTSANAATLTSGTVSLTGNSVDTAKGTIAAIDGTVTVNVNGETVTIGTLGSGDEFTFGGKTYNMTTLGLRYDSKLYEVSSASVTTDDIADTDADAWKTILEAPSGVLTIGTSTPSNVMVVDTTATPAVKYGTLETSDNVYTFTQDGSALNGVKLNGVMATLPASIADKTITTATSSGTTTASFTVTASGTVTVDASANVPTVSGMTAISLTSGTINAPENIQITAGDYTIAATGGDGMTVSRNGSTVTINSLNSGDTFTLGGKTYVYNAVGLFNTTDKARVTSGLSNGTLTLPATETQILAPTNGTLDLSNVTTAAEVYDSISNPTTKYADVTTSASGLTLDGTNAAANITTVNIARGSNWTIDFVTDVTTTRGTVNGQAYTGTGGTIKIHSDGSKSTLTDGTVTLTDTSVPTAKGTIAATEGTLTVNVNGETVTIGALGSGDEFTFGGKTYTVAAVGLVSDGALKSVGTSITTDDLSSDWQTMIEAPSGNLTIGTSTGAGVVVNSTSNPTVNYGTLTQGDSGYVFTANAGTSLSSVTINNVAASLPATSATITANSATFTASGALTVDATTSIPSLTATAVTLTAGTINAPANVTVTISGRRITATNGDMTIGLVGSDTQIGSLNVGDKFTIGNTEYELTSAGLYIAASGQLVTQGLSSDMTTYTVSDDTAYDNVITLTNGVLNLTSTPADGYSALIVSTTDGNPDPTKKIASISYTTAGGYVLSSPGDYVEELKSITLPATATTLATTINTTVNTARGSATYTINGKTFAASRSALTVETTAANAATLTSGTVTLTDNSVDTAKGSVAATDGTVTVNVNGDTVTIGALGSGDEFTFGNKTYAVSAVGLVESGNLRNLSGSSLTTDDLSDDWQTMIEAPSGNLTIGTSTGAGVVVNSTSNPTVNYGTLTQGDSGYVFTQNGSNTLSSVTINNVAASLPATSATITANSATFTASGALTVDATTSIPSLTATAVTLTAGTINAPSNVTVTVGGRRITATNGDMTIGLVGSDTQIGSLNVGDKFTIGNTEYELTSAGLYVAASGQLVTQGLSADMTTYTVSDDTAYDNVITLTNGVLNLTSTPADGYSALIVSTTNGNPDPTKKIAKVSYTTANGYVLSEQGAYYSELQAVSLNAVPTFTTALETTVNTAATGTYTINAKSFTASNSTLTIDAASNSATLTGGRISLAAGYDVTTPSATLASTAGTLTVNVDGSTVTVGNLSNGKAFTVDGTAYTVSAIGLVNDESLKSVGSSVTLSDLTSGWQSMLAAPNGALIINTTTGSDLIVVNSTSNPTINYGTLAQDNSVYTFTDNAGSSLSSITLNGVTATLPATSATISANGATFTATATDTLNVDASIAIPTISGVSALNLTAGTINAPDNIPITVAGKRITATGGSMTVGIDNNKVFVGNLNIGDTFTVGSVAYELTSAGLYIADSGQLVTEGLSDDMTTFIVDDAAFGNIITLDENGNLDLTATPANGYTAFVAGLDDSGNPDPSKNIATVQYSSAQGYSLTAGANVEDLKSVSLNTVKNLNTLINTTVTTPASGTFVINGKTFAARSALAIETAANAATLTDGTITLAAGYDVTTPNDTIASTAGTLTVNVDGSTVTIGNLSAGKAFTVNDKPYTMTSIGLSDGTSINDISSAITTDQLSGDDWKTILAISNGALSINADTPTAAVIDISDPAKAIRYGMLTKSGLNYSFDTYGSNALKSITLSGVSATFDNQSGATLVANDATFSISASGSFNVDAATTVPTISGASAISLTAGTINAPQAVPVTVASKTITNTNGSISVGISDGKVFVGNLNAGDTFTVDKTNYLVTAGRELYDASNARMVTDGFINNTFTPDDAAYTAIIQVSGTNLDLTNQTQSALVYDSISNPNTRLATLVATGSSLTLTAEDDNIIRSVDIAAETALTVDFDATVNAAGSATVNGEDYSSNGSLVIISDGSSAALYEGSVSLNPASATPKIYNDASTLAVNSGSVVANVADGYYSTLSDLNSGESFTFNGTSYTQSALGLVSNGSVAEALAGSTIDLSRLASAIWTPFLAPDSNGTLDLQGVSDNAVVYDDLDNPSKKLADLSVYSDSGRLYLNGSAGASGAIGTVLIDDGDNLTLNFNTQVSTSGGTVNGLRYNGAGSLTIDAKNNNSTLFEGTVILDSTNSSAKASKGSAISVGDGTSIYATANSGRFVEVSDLATGESFTYGGTTYTQTAFGLVTNGTIREDLAGSSVVLDDLDGTWSAFLAPKSGTLDLSSVKADSVVYDSATAPTRRLAGLTVSGATLTLDGESSAASYIDTVKIGKDKDITLDFTAEVTAPKGSVTVNGKEYDAQTDVTLTSDGTSSTLTKGTIKVGGGDSVTATSGNRTIGNAGDKALTLEAKGATLTVSNLSSGSIFAVDGTEYLLTNAALFKTGNATEATPANSSIYTGAANVMTSGSITVAQLDEDAWGNLLELPANAALTVTPLMDNLSTTGDSVQLVSSDLANFYGTLTKTADGYSLTKSGANANLTAINVNGTALVIAPAFLSVPLAAGDSQFSSLALSSANNTFTVDDTGSVPALTDNVSAFKLDTGAVQADAPQRVTAGKHSIKGDVIITVNDATVTVSEISAGEEFTLDGKKYNLTAIGLVNVTDTARVTAGFTGTTLTVNDMEETAFIGATDNVLDLTKASTSAPVYDSATAPTKQIGTLTVAGNVLTLRGTAANTVDTINIASGATLTVDFAAQVEAPQGTTIVNGNTYRGTTELTLQSDGTSSSLKQGTVALTNGGTVTTTSGTTIATTAGDGLTVTAASGNVTINGLNAGDEFTVDGTAYKVNGLAPLKGDSLWTGEGYAGSVTVSALTDGANWTRMQSASYGAFAVNGATLEKGDKVILVDNISDPTTTYGTLTKPEGEYLLMKDDRADEKLASITVATTIINIDTELADVPITTINADASESVFTVKPYEDAITFRVDATGNSPRIDGVYEIDLISGKVEPQAGQIVKPADGTGDITISYGNGTYTIGDKTITIGGLQDGETVDIDTDANGNIKNIHGLPKDSYVIIDDTTYTAPFDEAVLTFDEDGWYFEGYTLPAYNVRIDADGNISVDTGIRFSNVLTSGKKLGTDGKLELSGTRGTSSVTITNESEIPLNVLDSDGSELAENLSAEEAVTFSQEGVEVSELSDAAGATFNLKDGQSLTDGSATVSANGEASVAVGEAGISVAGSARIEAPAATELTLGAAEYEVNGVEFTSAGTTQASTTAKGVEIDLSNSDGITYDGMTLSGAGEAIISGDDVTLSGGAKAENTTGKALTVEGKVLLDDKTVNTAEAVEVTTTADGLNVGDTTLTVGGDGDGYQINIVGAEITGLENIGSASGVTVGGLSDASIHTDKASALTVGDKTFMTNDNSVTWIDEGEITGAEEVNGWVSGDFSDGLTINGTRVQVTSGKGSNVSVAGDDEGVTGVLTEAADEYTINGKTYETSGRTAFVMDGGKVTGAQLTNGTLAIGQNETDFGVNDENLTLSRNSKPVTLGVTGGAVGEVYGVDGSISGLSNAVVYDLTKATVNGVPLDVSGTTYDAQVEDGTVARISGLSSPATINSAPDMEVVTGENGSYTFEGNTYNMTDTVDSSVTFTTDANSNLTGINDFAGSVSGAVTSLNLNGKAFGTNDGNVTVTSNGTNITRIEGVKNGDSIGGDLDSASFYLPQGNITINGGKFTIEDDADGAEASSGGKVITGLAKDASLTVGTDGSYRVNSKSARASVGGVFTVNRDGSYLINPEHLPIIEKTPANVVRQRGGSGLELVEGDASIGTGADSVVVRNNAQATVEASGEPLIVATSGNVTLENYADGKASIGTFEYTNIGSAIRRNSIQFGDGVMTLGDAVITFDEEARSIGATRANLVNAQGKEQAIGFTHTAGGTINAGTEAANLVLKGNYAEKSSDTQKSGASELTGGSGNDLLLIGGGDSANAGAGNDRIYVTDGKLRNAGAVIYLSAGKDTVHHFNGGYTAASDKIIISDLSAIEFEASNSSLVLKSGDAQLTFKGMAKSTDLVTSSDMATSADTASNFKTDGSYRLQLQDGNKTYNAAVAQSGKNIGVIDGDAANVFYGKNSGINFSEYTGSVSVNLNDGAGNIGSQGAQFHGINKLKGGAGSSTLLGAADESNTLIAGTGDGQIWSNSGKDLLIGNTTAGKTGTTTFKYLEGDGQDTITGFAFGSDGDMIDITTANAITSVKLSGSNVLLEINGNETDYLTLAQGKGNDFKINNLVAKVDDKTLAFDGEANCYVAQGKNARLTVSDTLEAAQVWLNDAETGRHGTYYLGDIRIVDGSKSGGTLILTGNDLNNTIIGGSGTNSIWGGYGYDNDVLIGGAGKNTFFFGLVNGNDVIQGAHDGDVIDLGTLTRADIAGTAIGASGAAIALTDGSLLEVRSNAAIEYKTAEGTYTADHASGQWIKKE